MKLEGELLVLDTNILVHWMRGQDAGQKLRADYGLGARRPRPIVPVVVKAEIKSFAPSRNLSNAGRRKGRAGIQPKSTQTQ